MSDYYRAVSACFHIKQTNYLYIRGFFIGPEKCDKLLIRNSTGKVIGQAQLNLARADVANKYPQYKNRNSGWIFSGDAGPQFDGNIVMAFYKGNKELHHFSHTAKSNAWIDTHIQWLRRRHEYTVVKPGQVPVEYLLYQISSHGIPLQYLTIDKKELETWRAKAGYEANYAAYCQEYAGGTLLAGNVLQHYLSLAGKKLDKNSVCLDVASGHSPLPDVIRRLYGAKSYRQDKSYPEGLKDDTIGSDAIAIPLPNESVDSLTLHCSWEHFERDGDMLFLYEALRLLKTGGTLWIGPLYLDVADVVVTAPHVWPTKYHGAVLPPLFSQGTALCFDESACQRQEKFLSPQTLYRDCLQPLSPYADFAVAYYENHASFPGGFPFSLVLTKTHAFA